MRFHRKTGCVLAFAGVLLGLYVCVQMDGREAARGAEPRETGVSMEASFRGEDGEPLGESTVRVSTQEQSADYPLSGSGELVVADLSRNGKLTLTVLDRREQVRGSMDLTFSEGAVIDAVTDGGGAGHITLKRDTEEIALAFLLKEDGAMVCTLRLDQGGGEGEAWNWKP